MATSSPPCASCLALLDAGQPSKLRAGAEWEELDLGGLKSRAQGCRTCLSILGRILSNTADRDIGYSSVSKSSVNVRVVSPTQIIITCYIEYQPLGSESTKNLLLASRYSTTSPLYPTIASICNQGSFQELAPGTARKLEGQTNVRLLRHWRELCSYHGAACSIAPGRTECIYLRLVDIRHRCIKDANTRDSYVALSYVWGAARSHRLTTKKLGSYQQRSGLKRLPQTIEDAMAISLELGYEYLFVDAVCIVQDDAEDVERNVSAMDVIYGMADITLVNAAGAHAGVAIPGVQPDSRPTHRWSIALGDLELLEDLNDSNQLVSNQVTAALRSTVWNQRGWTYQERQLSRRLLIFTNRRVVWECASANYCEDIALETMQLSQQQRNPQRIQPLLRIHRIVPTPHDHVLVDFYCKLVSEFTERKLTFQSDIVFAFEGIKQSLSYCYRLDFLWSMPLAKFWFLLLFSVESDNLAPLPLFPTPPLLGVGFIETVYPTWSWVSWRGKIRHTLASGYASVPLQCHHLCRPLIEDNKLIGLQPLGEDLPGRPYEDQDDHVPNFLQLSTQLHSNIALAKKALVFRARVFDCTLSSDDTVSITTTALLKLNHALSGPSSVSDLKSPTISIAQWHHLPEKQCFGVAVELVEMIAYQDGQLRRCIMFLVVVRRQEVCFRVGLCTIYLSILRNIPASGISWRTVELC